MKRIILFQSSNLLLLLIIIPCCIVNSCKKNNTAFSTDKTFNITLSAKNELLAVPNRSETGSAVRKLYSDNALNWFIWVNDKADQYLLTTARINPGDAATLGKVLFSLVDNNELKFVGGFANGSMKLTKNQAAILNTGYFYVNANSNQEPIGLMCGPLE